MKKTQRLSLAVYVLAVAILISLVVFGQAVIAGGPSYKQETDQILVKFKDGVSSNQIKSVNSKLNGKSIDRIAKIGVHKVKISKSADIDEKVKQYEKDPKVEYAEPNYQRRAFVNPNDPYFGAYQWNLPNVSAPQAWDVQKGSADVVIAIIDTGVSPTHTDLDATLVAGYDFVNNDADPRDDQGHGTFVAGIAAAETNNLNGIAGISWYSKIMPVKVLGSNGMGWDSDIADGIVWAVDHGAKVINLSLGWLTPSVTMQNAINYAYNNNVVVVAAAGNNMPPYATIPFTCYPAAFDHVIAVSATNSSNVRWLGSNYGSFVDLSAPGEMVFSTFWSNGVNGYGWGSGTSAAAPHVAAAAALLRTQNPSWTVDQIEQKMLASADDIGAPGRDDYYGYGKLNCANNFAAQYVSLTSSFGGQTLSNQFPLFSWQTMIGATGYGLELLDAPPEPSEENGTTASIHRIGIGVTPYTFWNGDIRGLPVGTYYYRVIAWNNYGFIGGFSDADSFVVPKVNLSSSFSGQTLTDQFPLFSWQIMQGATSYGLELLNAPPEPAEENGNTASIHRIAVGVTPYTFWNGDIRGLPAGTYYYRVIAWNNYGFIGGFSDTDSFVVPKPQLNAIVWNDPTHPTFSWQALSGATSYSIELLWQTPENPNGATASQYRLAAGGTANTFWDGDCAGLNPGTYYYRIIASDQDGVLGGYSDVDSFIVAAP